MLAEYNQDNMILLYVNRKRKGAAPFISSSSPSTASDGFFKVCQLGAELE
jgi:hypothetical protein